MLSDEGGGGGGRGGAGASDSGSEEGGERVCRICSDDLTPEQFASGEAIRLACQCKGAMERAHRECALKWFKFRGEAACEVGFLYIYIMSLQS